MGLNKSYRHVRSDILLRTPMLNVSQAYSVVIQEESQRSLGVVDLNRDLLNLLAGMGGMNNRCKFKKSATTGTIGTIPGTIYEHCGFKVNLKKNYYRLVGYPPEFKSKWNLGSHVNKDIAKPTIGKSFSHANHAVVEEGQSSAGSSKGHYISDEQYQHYMSLKGKTQNKQSQDYTGDSNCNFACISFLLSQAEKCEWIIDSWVSHHITPLTKVLNDLKQVDRQDKKVMVSKSLQETSAV